MTENLKHKTVGVSFPPDLRRRAAERARGLGLSFSKYVTLCIESEVTGRFPQLVVENLLPKPESSGLNLEAAIEEGSEYSAMKAASIGFEDDVETVLKQDDFCYERSAQAAHLRTDFLISNVNPESGKNCQIALECKYNIVGRATVALGQAVILKSLPGVSGVVLCVPYLKHFDPHVREAFLSQGIPVTTPDNVGDVLREVFKQA